ncbi:MAG: mismatch-specific DNA-glycosylase [Paracoccaceae bacterium]|nr:MAG: mismatch-specific DNA-glycosylase [Paracoccaceae bacterium]
MILPDHLAPGLLAVFCGTAPGHASARRGHYYANPGNRFWTILHETGMTPRRLSPAEDRTLPALGLGLTDLAKTVAGQDADLPPDAFDPGRFLAAMAAIAPRAVGFTSLTAARIGLGRRDVRPGRQAGDDRLPGVAIFALPSPSGLARSHFRIGPWQEMADHLAALPRPAAVPPASVPRMASVPTGRAAATGDAQRAQGAGGPEWIR